MKVTKHQFRRALRSFKEREGLKQKQLAALILTDPRTVEAWLQGRTMPTNAGLAHVCHIIGIVPQRNDQPIRKVRGMAACCKRKSKYSPKQKRRPRK